jgi:hypothetical protein
MLDHIGSEVLKAIGEYLEMSHAFKDAPSLMRSLEGSKDEVLLYRGFARYRNLERFWDAPLGLLLITSERLVFVAKKKIPLARNTEQIILTLSSIEQAKGAKYRLGYSLNIVSDNKEYVFILSGEGNIKLVKYSPATIELVEHLAQLLEHAKMALLQKRG